MNINLLPIQTCERIDSPEGRLYKTPDGYLYPSVSTVLGATDDNKALDEWRAKVGIEVADKISKKATVRGSLIHENVENFILGKPETFSMFQVEEKMMFRQLMPVLEHCDNVVAMETPMWSDITRSAGTPDLICNYRGVLTIVDWKTSGRFKRREDIPNYFIQTAAYAQMFYERTGYPIGNILIAMTTQDDGLLLFQEKVKDWFPKWQERRNKFDLL